MSVRVYGGAALGAYGFPQGHPFGPDRLAAFEREFTRRGLDKQVELATAGPCTEAELALFHTHDYINRVRRQSKLGQGFLDHGDTPAFPGVFEVACTVVGSTLEATRWVLESNGRYAFVPIAGLHHARRDSAAGFCVFNDIGVLIEWLRATHAIRRIAYIDIDAHHGDGVFYSFEDDSDLIFADTHEDGRYLYPGTGRSDETGRGDARGTKLNIPLEPGADDREFQRHWSRMEQLVREGRPEFIILQAGADSIGGDPLAHLALSPASHGYAAARLKALADELCQGRLVALGGGGYHRANLAAAWCAVVEALLRGTVTA